MTFSTVPKNSKSEINKAGKILSISKKNSQDYSRSLEIAEQWRACHAYPLNTFNTNLRVNIRKVKGATIVAQRLKRMPTIIDKLSRFPTMKLAQMQDIGGVRAIVNSIEEVKQLAKIYQNTKNTHFAHQLVNEKNYIESPRNEDGYRSLHFIYKYKNRRAESYNGLLIELQIRTKLQHMWATAVETMDTLTGQALKYRKGQKEWQDFFAVTSSAFAHIENSTLIPRFKHLNKEQTFEAVAKAEEQVKALDQMKGLSIAADKITKSKANTGYYHLIILNSLKKTVSIISFSKDKFQDAERTYSHYEERALIEKVEPVLVAAGTLKDLQKAYPNFFLDVKDFTKKIEEIIIGRR